MEALGIIGTAVGILGGLFGLYFYFKKCFKSALKTELIPITLDLAQIHKDINSMNKQRCESFIVKYLNEREHNIPQNAEYDQLAHEIKDRAVDLKVNSYIAKKWEKLTGEKWKE